MTGPDDAAAPAHAERFTIARTFDAAPESVFAAWTRTERPKRWFAPRGVTMPACTMDLRPGGAFH